MEKEKATTQAQEEEIEDVFEYIKGRHFEDIKREFFEDYPDYEDSIEWVIKKNRESLIRTVPAFLNVDAEKCDTNIKHCPNCEKCWELPFPFETIHYYIDFNKYERESELCPKCQDLQERLIKED